MTESRASTVIRLGDVAGTARHHLRLLGSIVLLSLLAAVGYGITVPREYTSTATLVVSPITTNPFASTAPTQTINISTEREILASSEVARIAGESLGEEISADSILLNQVDVAAPSGSQILAVSVKASSPEVAADSANAMANAYLAFRAQGANEVAVSFIAAIDEQLAALANSDEAGARDIIASLQEQRASLAIVGDNPGRLIGSAIPSESPSSLGLPVFLVAGLFGGLILGLVAVLIWDRANPRVGYRTRLDSAIGERALTVRSPVDAEGLQWILRAVDRAAPRPSRPIPAVAVFGAGEDDETEAIVRAIASTAVADGRSVVMYFAADFDPDDLGWGWPSENEFTDLGGELIVIEGTRVRSGARRATLADRVTCSVVVAGARSRLRQVTSLIDDLRQSPEADVVPVFLASSTPAPPALTTRSAADEAAGAREDAPARQSAGSGGAAGSGKSTSRAGTTTATRSRTGITADTGARPGE